MHVTIATVSETLFDGDAKELIVPGIDGELTILGHHMPLVTTLKKGTATVVDARSLAKTQYVVDSGVLEVSHNRAIVLL